MQHSHTGALVVHTPQILFTGDNGPWLVQGFSAGSMGIFYGRSSGYWNTGKGCTWEGGIREAGFAYWPGVVKAATRTDEVVSSMDLLPTALELAGIPLPTDRPIDGKSMLKIIKDEGPSDHDVLFFYASNMDNSGPTAARVGPYKAHWVTSPGIGGCPSKACTKLQYPARFPLLFNVEEDPSEAFPLCRTDVTDVNITSCAAYSDVLNKIHAAYENELATFTWGHITPVPGAGPWGVCCSRSKGCDCNGKPSE